MLNFRDNFFFAKFTVLFFILTIFGYWGIDLNSEELYIAFSFFLLVILGVILSRQAILLLFVKSVNAKFFRILSDLLVVVSALTLRVFELRNLNNSIAFLQTQLTALANAATSFFAEDGVIVRNSLRAKAALLGAFLPLSSVVFAKNLLRLKNFYSFTSTAKFFSIKF